MRNTWPGAVIRSPSSAPRTQPVPSMAAWADGSASTANTASGTASIVVDAVRRSGSMPMRRRARPELIEPEALDDGGAPGGPPREPRRTEGDGDPEQGADADERPRHRDVEG